MEIVRKPPRVIFAENLNVDLLVNLQRNHIFTFQFTSKFMTKLVLHNLHVNFMGKLPFQAFVGFHT